MTARAVPSGLLAEGYLESREKDLVESGELVVYYQPKLDLRTRSVSGAEALVRWLVPSRGLAAPVAFVPFYERSGYIVQVDRYVFGRVCERLRIWLDAGIDPVPVSFNLSRAHLANPAFLDAFERIRKRWNVPPGLLDFELTETLLVGSPFAVADAFGVIRAAGYRSSIDDFGSGLSSLGMLKDAQADSLKLDRAFLSPTGCDPMRGKVVVESVVAMAKRLGMSVVCEGVESASWLDGLEGMGCDLAQGFAIAPALPPDEFEIMAYGRTLSQARR